MPSCNTGRRSLCPHPATIGTPHLSEGGDINTPHTHSLLFFPFNFIYSFFFFWLRPSLCCYVGFSVCVELGLLSRCGAWASHCGVFSCAEHRLLGAWTSVIMAHRLCCSEACGIFRDWGWNPCPLRWQVDSYPLDCQGNPGFIHS